MRTRGGWIVPLAMLVACTRQGPARTGDASGAGDAAYTRGTTDVGPRAEGMTGV